MSQFQRKTNNPRETNLRKHPYKPSNINIQRKLSKQNIAKTNNNTSIAQKFILNRQNKIDYNKPKSTALAASNTDEENFKKNKRKLRRRNNTIEVASLLKKDQLTPPQHVIPVRRQTLHRHYQNRQHKR